MVLFLPPQSLHQCCSPPQQHIEPCCVPPIQPKRYEVYKWQKKTHPVLVWTYEIWYRIFYALVQANIEKKIYIFIQGILRVGLVLLWAVMILGDCLITVVSLIKNLATLDFDVLANKSLVLIQWFEACKQFWQTLKIFFLIAAVLFVGRLFARLQFALLKWLARLAIVDTSLGATQSIQEGWLAMVATATFVELPYSPNDFNWQSWRLWLVSSRGLLFLAR